MKIAYFDCFAGAAGDMIVAAMLDAGLDAKYLSEQLDSLAIDKLEIKIAPTTRCGLAGLTFTATAAGDQPHRNLDDITKIISQSKITQSAKERAIAIFTALAQAEAAVHGKSINQIHFHEVGAVDSIVDIVAACIGLEALNVDKVYCSVLSVGGGIVKCAHGIIPAPAPATVELLKQAKTPIAGGPGNMELFTPTAAAVLTNFAQDFGPLPPMTIDAVGCGAGSLQSDEFPNLLRLITGQSADTDAEQDCVCLLEANIDDATGEMIGFATEMLLETGALDVFTTPIQMKHNRPAVKLSVICTPDNIKSMEDILFGQGLTFGIRKQLIQRSKLTREFVTVKTEFGKINVKTGYLNGRLVTAKPEYSDCAQAAKHHNIALKTVQQAAIQAFKNQGEE